MAKKSTKKAPRQLASETEAKQFGSDYPAEPYELDGQRQRLRKAAAAGAEALKSPTPAAKPDPYPAPAAVSSPPLAPLAALWPNPAPSQRDLKVRPASRPTNSKASHEGSRASNLACLVGAGAIARKNGGGR